MKPKTWNVENQIVQTHFYYNEIKNNINIKITKQKYSTRLYFKLMLNKLNVMGGPTFNYTPLGI